MFISYTTSNDAEDGLIYIPDLPSNNTSIKFSSKVLPSRTSTHTMSFEKVRDILIPIHFEISARGKHVGDIEREVRTLMELCFS